MTFYSLTNEPNQTFTVTVNGKQIQMSLRWMPALRSWIGGITGVVEGVRISTFVPVFAQYGYPEIFFVAINGNELTDDISGVEIAVSDRKEVGTPAYNYVALNTFGEVVLK